MSQQVYWSAPLWQVLLVAAISLLVLAWLARRALRPPDVGAALRAHDPSLAHPPLFFFDSGRGVTALNWAAVDLLNALRQDTGTVSDDVLVEVMLRAYERAQVTQHENWPAEGQRVVAVPTSAKSNVVSGVLAIVVDEGLSPPVADMDSAALLAGPHVWVDLGPTLKVHIVRPVVRVRRSDDSPSDDGDALWRELTLSHFEDRALRFLMNRQATVQPAADLFGAVWPDDEVDDLGLRPDQKDRLRQLIYQLRQQVEPQPATPRYVCTAHGIGYVLYGETEPVDP